MSSTISADLQSKTLCSNQQCSHVIGTPLLLQVFKGCLLGTDILNHRNIDFWSHQQPAYNLRKFISCAGTNFCIRASAFIEAGALLPAVDMQCKLGSAL